MTGKQVCAAVRDGDAAKVSTLLSTQGAQSFINYQDEHGATPLFLVGQKWACGRHGAAHCCAL